MSLPFQNGGDAKPLERANEVDDVSDLPCCASRYVALQPSNS